MIECFSSIITAIGVQIMPRQFRKTSETDKLLIMELMNEFKNSSEATVLIDGFDDDDKIYNSLVAAYKLFQINNNLAVGLRVDTLKKANHGINQAFNKYGANDKVVLKQDVPLKIGELQIEVNKFDTAYVLPVSYDISIYYPINSVIDGINDKQLTRFRDVLEHDKSRLKIIVTVTDYIEDELKINKINDLIDKHLLLDSSQKYPDTYHRILDNLNVDKLYYE